MTQTGYRLTAMAFPAVNLGPAHSVPHATAYLKLISEHGNLSFRPDVDVSQNWLMEDYLMEKKIAGLLGVVATLGAFNGADAAPIPSPAPSDILRANSFADLLQPIPNAAALLQAVDESAPVSSTDENIQRVQYHHHHHHHHHHGYRRYEPRVIVVPHRRHHHHHHHHHHNY